MKYNLLKTMLTIPRHLIVISCLSLVLLTACGGSDSSNSPTSVPDPTETVSILTMAGENGAISASSSVDVGLDKTVVIMPDIGFVVFDVLIDSVSVGPIKVYEFSNVTTAHTVEAIFIEDDSNASMYKMAVGVPEPSIDFRQEKPPRPSDWSIEVPGYYYIDMVNGSKDQEYGTPTSPRKYLPTRLTESAYIEIEGDYDHGFKLNNAVILNYDGTDDSNWVAGISGPVWITKARGKSAAFTKVKIVLKGSNIFLTNMVFKEGARPQVGSPTAGYPAKNVLIRDIDVTGGIGILGSNAGSGSDSVVVYNSIFHDAGDIDADYDQDAHVVSINGFVSNVWLLSNTMHSASGAGMQIQAGFNNSHTTHNIYVADNEIFNVRQSGLWLKSGKNIVISSNYVHDIIDTPWSVSKGIGAQYEPDGLWIINNHIHGTKYGIRVGSTSSTEWRQKLYIIGNVIHDINALGEAVGPGASTSSWQPAAIHLAGMHEHHIYNNLIFDAPNGIDISGPSITQIRNNIILDVTESQLEGENGYHIWAELQDLNDNVFIDNNYFGSEMKVKVRHDKHETAASLNAVVGASDNIAGFNFITADDISELMQADTSRVDLSQIEELGINVDHLLVTDFTSIFVDSEPLNRDILGNPRILGRVIDIGPFEQAE